MPVDREHLKKKILEELHQSLKSWGGKGVEIRRVDYRAMSEFREEVNKAGKNFGCHTCGKKIELDNDQPWIGDHIPPTELSKKARENYGCGDKTYLFPQCDSCMHEQAGLVKILNSNPFLPLKSPAKNLICGGWEPKIGINCVLATGPSVSPSQALNIQAFGVKLGCHSCGRKYPASVYIADHVFPAEFCTSYMKSVFEVLGLPYPEKFELRPQCPKCSSYQGSQVKQVMIMAMELAKEEGITVYK